MDKYEQMEEELCAFKKYTKLTMDLMEDSYKWQKLAEYETNTTQAQKYQQISKMLYEMFMNELENIKQMF